MALVIGQGTETGSGDRVVGPTCWTMVLEAGSGAAGALDRLARIYWRPVYWHVRRHWGKSREDAKDLTQEFFSGLLEKELLQRADRDRGRFRSFLLATLDNFMRHYERDRRRLKRGGHLAFISIDPQEEDRWFALVGTPGKESGFDEVWAATLLQEAVNTLRERYDVMGRSLWFAVFALHDLAEGSPPEYEELARRFSITVHDVGNYLRHVRASLRSLVRERVRESLTGDSELDDEIRTLFGDA